MNGLSDLYKETYGSPEHSESITKLAEALQITEEEAAQALYAEGMIDEDGNWLGELDEETEKVAADYDAAGRIMAQGLMDELEKVGAGLGGITGFLKRILVGKVGEKAPAGAAQAIARAIKERKYSLPAAGAGGYLLARQKHRPKKKK